MKKLFFILVIFLQTITYAQTLEGMEGLFFIPSAEIHQDAQISIGFNYLDKSLVSFGDFKYSAKNYFITFHFLPFIEASLRITRLNGLPPRNNEAIGDRTPSIKIRVFEESDILPAISIGVHDLMTVFGGEAAVHNNACYLVATKNFNLDSFLSNIALTVGYGSDFMKAANHNFVGLFGGLSLHLLNHFELMTEYDGKRANCGLRIKYFDHLSLLGGFIGYKHFSGGISYYFTI